MDSRIDIIDAFVDGERVDAADLKRVLADPDGRDYFVDAWLLRESVQDEMAGDHAVVVPTKRSRITQSLLFAAALIVCLVGGYVVGYRVSGRLTPATDTAPVATPGQAVPATSAPGSVAVPAPTKVIQVQFSVDRSVTGGGD